MKYIYTLLFLLLLSCSSEDAYIDEGKEAGTATSEIKFRLGFSGSTKVATDEAFQSTFENGDAVGIFIVKEGEVLQSAGNYADNRKVVYNGTNWVLDGADIFYPTDGAGLSFYAYYPYQSSVDPTNLVSEVGTDQSNTVGYSTSDYLLAKAEDQRNAEIDLIFSHTLALVQIEVVRGKNLPNITPALEVDLHNCTAAFAADWATGTATEQVGTATGIKMLRVDNASNAHVYRALVPAQTIASGTKLFSFVQTASGSEIDNVYTTTAETILVAGKVTKWKVTLKGKELPAHNYQVGDVYPYTGTPIGIVFEISNGGENGKIVSLTNEFQNRWGGIQNESENGLPSIADANDGKTATRDIINGRKGWGNFKSDYAIFEWLYNTVNAGDINGEWYLPSKNELKSLYAASSGLAYSNITWADDQAMPGFDSQACKDARDAFNTKLTDAGGLGLHQWAWYWTTTEVVTGASVPNKTAWSVQFDTGVMQSIKIKWDHGRARPIMQF